MYLRSSDDGRSSPDRLRGAPIPSDRSQPRTERVREIRQRVADDVYRSASVVDELARRILCSGEL
jgi:hypothetical protein